MTFSFKYTVSMQDLPLPERFIQRLQQIISDKDWEGVWHSFHVDKPLVLRINTLRTETAQMISALEQEGIEVQTVAWKTDALIIAPDLRDKALASIPYTVNGSTS